MMGDQIASKLNALFDLNQRKCPRKLRYRWSCPVVAQEMGDFLLVPLSSSKELTSEGWHMQHCVATYDARCAMGSYHVFSVRDLLGIRVATLGLTYGANGLKVDQCLGLSNTDVMLKSLEWINGSGKHESMEEFTDIHYLALDVARLLNALTAD